MPSVCFYFQVHQPRRVKRYRVFDVGHDHEYFNDSGEGKTNNKKIIEKVSGKSYLPMNATLLEMIKKNPEFRCTFSLSGIFIEQLEEYAPETLASFQKLVATGNVEILGETYYHSLSALYNEDEFKEQVKLHSKKIKDVFGTKPKVFRNTELIWSDSLANTVLSLGFEGVLAEGADRILEWRSPNFLYEAPRSRDNRESLVLLLKNYRLSDDIAFRFGEKGWIEWPLTVEKFTDWVNAVNDNGDVVNLFMDYETFGEHQWESTGIFEFMKALPKAILANKDNSFVTASQSINKFPVRGELSFPDWVSWADVERDLTAWRGNSIQDDALARLYKIREKVLATKDKKLIEDWRRLTTSDHFYYMCTKWFADGDVHKYFNPYESPYDAYIAFTNVLNDLEGRTNVGKRLKVKG